MTFEEILDQAIAMLQRRGRMTYRALKLQFQLDDEGLEALKDELLYAHPQAVHDDGRGLVWTGAARQTPTPAGPSATDQERVPLSYTPPYLMEKILDARQNLEGERKQVTVLFADVKDSTELIRDLDPEAAQQLLDPVLRRMMDAVHRYEGTVNRVQGEGVMALFGAPIAHEDHALRACYAALAMQIAMRVYTEEVRRAHGLELRVRVGLNSGEVVVGAIGSDLHMEYSAAGLTVHLAARMEQSATPGSIRLTAATLRLVEGLVQVSTLGPVPVKGLPEPVEVFELTGASAVRRRLQAAAARGLTPFVGRQPELEALHQALARAQTGHGQVVALVGEAGVGKSRLMYECVHSHRTQGWRVLESASVSYGKATPYFPVIDLLKRYCHVDDGDNARTIRAKVTGQVLTLDETLQDTLPALLALLDAVPDDSLFLRLDPPQRRQRTLEALKRVLLRESQVQPLLLVCEDLHWIDSETQAFLESLIDSLPTAQLLLLINYRPEYQHAWGSKTFYTQLRLDPLSPAGAQELLQALLGDDPSLAPLKQLLVDRTEGNPFFLEESVRALFDQGILEHLGEGTSAGSLLLTKPLTELKLPATVQAVLAARIDRLPADEKRLLQTAAVIGTEVPLPLLQVIADVPEAVHRKSLAHLQAAGFLYESSLFPELEYTFKHALTHEVAYGSLLQERRHGLHARIAEAVEQLYRDHLGEQVERLAHHTFQGEQWDKAVIYLRQAGAKAMARSAHREALIYLMLALVALQHLPGHRDTYELAIDLRFDLRTSLFHVGEFEQIFDHLREAETLAEALEDQERLSRVFDLRSANFNMLGDHSRAVDSSRRAFALASGLGVPRLQASANFHLGAAYYSLGDYRGAIEVLRQNVDSLEDELFKGRPDRPSLGSVVSRTWLVWSLAELGAFSEGIAHGTEGIRIAEVVDRPDSLINAYSALGFLYLRQGDLSQAIPLLERGFGLYQDWQIPLLFPLVASALGAAYALSGRIAEALSHLEQAVAHAALISIMDFQSHRLASLGEVYLLAGRVEDARVLAMRALDLSQVHKERGWEAYVLRLLGDIAVRGDPPAHHQGEAYYQQAQTLAAELAMRPLVAHCHLGLGTLYTKVGQLAQARTALSTAIELFQAMEMTFWLPQAETALAQVGGVGSTGKGQA